MKKVLKIILIIVLLIIVLCIANFIRNYYIINKISNKQTTIANSKNYSFTRLMPDGTKMEVYHKGDLGKIILKENEVTYGEIWHNETTNEEISLSMIDKTATVSNYTEDSREFLEPFPYNNYNINDKINFSLSHFITYETINGEKCYSIKSYHGVLNKREISINTGFNLTYFSKGADKQYHLLCEYTMNDVTDKDVEKPDLTGYKI